MQQEGIYISGPKMLAAPLAFPNDMVAMTPLSMFSSTFTATPATSYKAADHQPTELVEFTPFPKLPEEIRRQIVEIAIDDTAQRTFTILSFPGHTRTCRDKESYRVFGHIQIIRATKFPVPSLLQVNSESRAAGMKVYDLSFSGPLNNKPIYLNFAKDRLFFTSPFSLATTKNTSSSDTWKKVENKLRYLVVGGYFWNADITLALVANFHKLKVFTHGTHDYESSREWANNSRAGLGARGTLLKLYFEGNWKKSHEYEELIAATYREASLMPEPVLKEVYELPMIKVLSRYDIAGLTDMGDGKNISARAWRMKGI